MENNYRNSQNNKDFENNQNTNQNDPQSTSLTPAGYTQNQNKSEQSQAYGEYFSVEDNIEPDIQVVQNKDKKEEKKTFLDFVIKKWWLFLTLFIILSLAVVGGFFWWTQNQKIEGDFTKIDLGFVGPKTLPNGNTDIWTFKVANNNDVAVEDVEVRLDFDEKFSFKEAVNTTSANSEGNLYKIPILQPKGENGSEFLIELRGSINGRIDEEVVFSGFVDYLPSPYKGTNYSKLNLNIPSFKTLITAPELSLKMDSKNSAVNNGESFELNITIQNLSEKDFEDVKLELDYPENDNFTYESSELILTESETSITSPDSGNNTWFITKLPKFKEQRLNVKGKIYGVSGSKQEFTAKIFTQNPQGEYELLDESSKLITVGSESLVLSTDLGDREVIKTFDPGESITFIIDYKNQGTKPLKNLTIEATLNDSADIIDWDSVSFSGGDKGIVEGEKIIWKGSSSSSLNELAPRAEGTLVFKINVKDEEDFRKINSKEEDFTISLNVLASGDEVEDLEIKSTELKARGYLSFDYNIELKESEDDYDVYTVRWELKARQNDVNNVKLESISNTLKLDGFNSRIVPSSEANNLSFDDSTGRLIWTPGKVSRFSGLLNPVKYIEFELKLSKNSDNNYLYTSPIITGTDNFTGERYEITGANGNI